MRLFSDCSNRRHSCGSFLLVSFVIGWFVPTELLVTFGVSATNVLPNPPTDHLSSRAPVRRGYLIRIGQSINLTCPYDVPFYSWTHSAQPNKILSDKQLLFIKSATLENSGRYVCQAIDGYGTNSADFAVRVIDSSAYNLQHECVLDQKGLVSADGPCFLTSYSDRDLNPTRAWGESVVLDCDAVLGNGAMEALHYRWDVTYLRPVGGSVAASSDDGTSARRLIARDSPVHVPKSGVVNKVSFLSEPAEVSSSTPNMPLDLSQFTESKLKLTHLNLRHNGEYRCIVAIGSPRSTSTGLGANGPRSETISRTFRLNVKPRADGPIILGPRITNETVSAGHDATFKCEVSPEEHRSSTIRWGKSIDAHQRAAYEAQGREVIHWAGGTFVVLPIITNTVLAELEKQSSSSGSSSAAAIQSELEPEAKRAQHGRSLTVQLPASGAVATEASANQLSRLLLVHAALADSGRYVCSVLTEDGRDDHKFVHVTVIGSSNGDADELVSGGMRRLTVYIAVPTVIFFICLCVVTYCLISRRASRTSRPGHHRHRTYYSGAQQSQIKSPSAASSSSIGVCRNGVTPGGTSWHTVTDPRLRPSPIGTGPGTTTLGYSSTNGSNSLPGNGQMLITTQGYPTSVPGSVTMVPGSYPILLQSMNTQQGTPMYAVQDPNAMGGYQPNIYPNSTAGGNEYMLTGNALSVFPAGVMYPVSNGHTLGNNNSQMMPNSTLNSSSPESSAITGPGSPLANETVEGRLVFQTGQPGQQPVFQTAYPNIGANFGYQSLMSSNTGDFDLAQSNTPLLPFPTHGDGAHHGGVMRA
ncbi:hypothetical protein EG68_03032 [Paragonimus skrjabini miyazakii]|uniref:Ig-like domain-containing protein n=1 Tax=Paragonimus skrjabini miyazakii TaxID=59628 RepID=A0A8S9YXM7_9TREM|nr:hypothetical protein EG68_03032 [Paragonimus skrjabini miyazakii]